MKRITIIVFLAFFTVLFYIDFDKKTKIEKNTSNISFTNDVELMSYSDYDTTISRKFANYDYNPNGICGTVSASIVLQYYDDYFDDNILPDNVENNELETIKRIMPYVDRIDSFTPFHRGSSAYEMYEGLNVYLSKNNISSMSFKYESYSTSVYCECIKYNKPVLIDLDRHPVYGEHWVVGYGYYTEVRKVTNIICIDGRGNSYVQIPISYIGYIVY